jgi:hypothetical protein
MNSHSGPRTFAPLTIRALLACAFTLLAVLLVAVGACGAFGISSTNEALESASEYVPALRAVDQQQKLIARARLKLERIASTIRLNASSRDEATQQNAALVEEAAAASNSMEEQAFRMREVVASFETGGAAH